MDLVKTCLDFLMHIDIHLNEVIVNYGLWTYLILFLIIFCETGLVVTPFLPGDSLLFAAGTFAAIESLSLWLLLVLLIIAAVAGDTINYWIGHYIGPKFPFINKKHLVRTHQFYEKYGGKTIIIARFIPIVRTFAPFVAGVGSMTYFKFISYNIIGGISWIIIFLSAGYFFGNLKVVKNNFSLVIVAIIFISILPGIIEYMRQRFALPEKE